MDPNKEKCPVCSSKLMMLLSDNNQMIQTSEYVCARFFNRNPDSNNHFHISFYGDMNNYLKQIEMRGYLISMDEDNRITIMYKDDCLMNSVRVENEFFNSLGKIETLKNFRMML